jgi:hypothetical protein
VTGWAPILRAVEQILSGESEAGTAALEASWADAEPTAHAQRCVIAHYLADQQDSLGDEVKWDERALSAYANVAVDGFEPIGIPHAAAMAPSLHLNLGDGYFRQGRLVEAREQLGSGLEQLAALPDDGYRALVLGGLTRLQERLDANAAESSGGR